MVHCRQLHVGKHYAHTQCFSAMWRLLLLIALAYPDLYEHKPTSLCALDYLFIHSQLSTSYRKCTKQGNRPRFHVVPCSAR
jgi:hypothetical protein